MNIDIIADGYISNGVPYVSIIASSINKQSSISATLSVVFNFFMVFASYKMREVSLGWLTSDCCF